MRPRNLVALVAALTVLLSPYGQSLVIAAPLTSTSSAVSTAAVTTSRVGTSSPRVGAFALSGGADVTQAEYPGQIDEPNGGPGPYPGTIVDRSLSKGAGNGVSVSSGKKAKSAPQYQTSFPGLNLYQQRYARGGNQFTVEPPDQALCVGGGYVLEAVNDVLNVYNTFGHLAPPGQHGDQHRLRLPEERRPRRRPELVLRLRSGDRPLDRCAGTVRHRPILPLRRRHPAVLRGRADSGDHAQRSLHGQQTTSTSRSARQQTRQGSGTSIESTSRTTARTQTRRNACPCLGDYPHIGADANGVLRHHERVPLERRTASTAPRSTLSRRLS